MGLLILGSRLHPRQPFSGLKCAVECAARQRYASLTRAIVFVERVGGPRADGTTRLLVSALWLALDPHVQFMSFHQHDSDARRSTSGARFSH